ncbi:hypothetical protein ACFV2N_36655 [Streptomyces sp. NPDC059680]|uniref:hypothetical protein n=1 Tax=Streptomyces sp. NPDC059680 TaxID=3346904 RepID=UPI0036BE2049
MPAYGKIIDLSDSPQAKPNAHYEGLGHELHVVNPRFLGPHVTDQWLNVGSNPSLDGWAVTSGNIDIFSAGFARTGNLSQAVNLNGGEAGEIQQELLTTPGHRVTVKMRAGHNNGGDFNKDAKFWIQVNGNTATRITYNLGALKTLVDDPSKENYWHEVTYEFTAEGHDVLQLHGDPDGGAYAAIATEIRAYERAV